MAVIPLNTPALAGTPLSWITANAGGDTLLNSAGRNLLLVNNASGASINVTITAQKTSRPGDSIYPTQTVGNQVVPVAAGQIACIGPIALAYTNDSAQVSVSTSSQTSITLAGIAIS